MAPDLIGNLLVRFLDGKNTIKGLIVETEAYSEEEESCHGHNKRTKSNNPLFGEPGTIYIYKSYGLHHCFNLVTDRNNFASGVLIRAIEIEDEGERYASGPGLVSRSLKIGLNFNSLKIYSNKYLRLYDCGFKFNDGDIINTKRIGITKSKELNWRWYLKHSRSVSKRKKGDKTPQKELFPKFSLKKT